MKTIADALVYAVAYLNVCTEEHDADRQFQDGVAVATIGQILRQLGKAGLDGLAAAAKRALADELAKGAGADPNFVARYRTWMQDVVDNEFSRDGPAWDGNDRLDPIDLCIDRCRAGAFAQHLRDKLIGHVRDPRVAAYLLEIIGDPGRDYLDRIAAIQLMETGLRARDGGRLRDLLLDILKEPVRTDLLSIALRSVAYHGYGKSPKVAHALLEILRNPERGATNRIGALEALAGSGNWSERGPIVRSLLKDADPHVAKHASFLLGRRRSGRKE